MLLKYVLKNVLFFAAVAIVFILLLKTNVNKMVNAVAPQAIQYEMMTGEPLMQEETHG
jgi:hypothetical protein